MLSTSFNIVVKTFSGLEEVLLGEIQSLGIQNAQVINRAVTLTGNLETVYLLNYRLRTALFVLAEISSFSIESKEDLYAKTKEVPWGSLLTLEQTFAISSTIFSDLFTHTNFPALVVKDAIADYFMDRSGKRPDVDRENPTLEVNVHINQKAVNLSVNTSGVALYKRGYRLDHHQAPLNEVLAAGLISLSGWQPEVPLHDPMCGSGTIVMEAAMKARNIAPGKLREFAFQHHSNFDRGLLRKVKREAKLAENKVEFKISGADISEEYVGMAIQNAERVGLASEVDFFQADFFDRKVPTNGIMLTNPPYGVRLRKQMPDFYHQISATLKHKGAGSTIWIFSGDEEGEKELGLRPFKRFKLYNGNIPSWFNGYEMVEGKLKKEE